MNQKILNIIFAIGATLVLISSVLVMEHVAWGKYVFASGVALFFFSRLKMVYTGPDFRLKRLNRLYFMSSLFLVIASCLQFRAYNAWIVLLLLVAILEFYTSMRASVYEKENQSAAEKNKTDDSFSNESSSRNSIQK